VEKPIISPEFRDKAGAGWTLGEYQVERGMIKRFVKAIGDPNPRWEGQAPPTFILTIGGEEFGQRIIAPMFPSGLLHGSTELECLAPVRPGDEITVTGKIAAIRERPSSKMAFVTFEITYQNQRHELVARCQQTMIAYAPEGAKP